MNKADNLINGFRKKKAKIIFFSFLGFVALALSVVFFMFGYNFLQKSISSASLLGNPILAAVVISNCFIFSFCHAFIALFSVVQIIENLTFSRDQLLVEMWDKIKELENKNK